MGLRLMRPEKQSVIFAGVSSRTNHIKVTTQRKCLCRLK